MALDRSDPEAVRSAAREILSQPQFAHEKLTLWKEILYYISHPSVALDDLLRWIVGQFTGNGIGTVFAWIFVVVALGVVIAIAVLLTRSTARDRMTPVGMTDQGRERTSAEVIADAEAYEREGNWREALRSRYSALVLDLGVMGIVRVRPGKTTGEYLAEVRSNWPDSAVHFAKATELFELAWYGHAELSSQDIEVFRQYAVATLSKKSKR